MTREMLRLSEELGIAREPGAVLAALAKIRDGHDAESAARGLTWSEFEEFCAAAVTAAGYAVRRNVKLKSPRRQLDLLADSSTMCLSIDCKHWRRGAGWGALEKLALAQVERTRQYANTQSSGDEKVFLPLLLTMTDNLVRIVNGVPVVPVYALRDFLASVNRFDENLAFIRREAKER